jgi:hypothetical protein
LVDFEERKLTHPEHISRMEKFIGLTTIAAFLIFAGTYALSARKIHGASK